MAIQWYIMHVLIKFDFIKVNIIHSYLYSRVDTGGWIINYSALLKKAHTECSLEKYFTLDINK